MNHKVWQLAIALQKMHQFGTTFLRLGEGPSAVVGRTPTHLCFRLISDTNEGLFSPVTSLS